MRHGSLASATMPRGVSPALAIRCSGPYALSTTGPDGSSNRSCRMAEKSLTPMIRMEIGSPSPRRGGPPIPLEYTPVGLAKNYLPPNAGADSKDTSYAYNQDKQLTKISRPDGKVIEMAYDNAGHLETVTLPGGKLRLAFDAKTEQLKTIMAPDGGTLSFTYDGFLLTKTTWQGPIKGSVSRTYDKNLRLTSQSVNGGRPVAFKHDPDGLLTQAGDLTLENDPQNGLLTGTKLGKLTTTQSYNGFGEPKRYAAAFKRKELSAVQYARDALGHIIKLTETIDDQTSTYTYDYDLAGRLTGVTKNGTKVAHYDYDSNGNRRAYKGQHGTFTASYDAQDRLIKYGDITYTHTANGEWLTQTGGGKTTHYDYNVFGNLRALTLPDGTKIEYLIDGKNRRVGKKVNGKLVQGLLYQDGLRPVVELDGQNNVVSRFIYATKINVPEYMEKGSKTYRIITDHLGSPRLVIDVATGEIAQRMDYDEFGNVLSDRNPGFQPFGFAGGMYDPHTKLTRFGARDYDAFTGQWTRKDPIGFAGGYANLYTYSISDPINRLDQFGLQSSECPAACYDKPPEWDWSDFWRNTLGTAAAGVVTGWAGGVIVGGTVTIQFGGIGVVPAAPARSCGRGMVGGVGGAGQYTFNYAWDHADEKGYFDFSMPARSRPITSSPAVNWIAPQC